MILKGNQRGGGRQMALHLLNAEANEHVHEVRGFMADNVLGAFNAIHAISKSLYLEYGWQLPDGFKDKTQQPPAKAGGLALRTESPDTGQKTRFLSRRQ